MSDHPYLKRCALSLGVFTLAAAPFIQAGNPWDSEPTEIPEEAYDNMPSLSTARNPKNRFGVQGGLMFGVKAKFLSSAFSGENITAIAADGAEIVQVNPAKSSARERHGLGGEIFYERVLGESDLVTEGVNETWGVHVGFGYHELSLRGSTSIDSFRPVEGGEPTYLSQGSMEHDLEADLWHLNVGLFKESYLTENLYAKVGGGLSAAYIDAEVTVRGPFDFADENASEQDFLFGAYVDLTLGYDVTENWGLYAGLRYQYLSSFEMDTSFSETELSFNQSYMAFLGVRFSF